MRLAGRRDSAARLARGIAAGIFAMAFPFPGVQIPLSVLFAWIARGNKAMALIPQLASNALTMLPQALVQFQVGGWLWPGRAAHARDAFHTLRGIVGQWSWNTPVESFVQLMTAMRSLSVDILGPLFVGILVTGTLAALASYPLTIVVVWTWRAWRRSRRVRRRVRHVPPRPLFLPEPEGGATEDTSVLLAQYARRSDDFTYADRVILLINGHEAYPKMLQAIADAKNSIALEVYIVKADRVGIRFQQALVDAARRGVRVRLLYDYVGSLGLPGRFITPLVNAGVDVAVYNPLVWNRPLWTLNRRDHRKMLIVDEQMVFTGGLNIADDYDAREAGGGGWRDTQVCVEGREPAQAALHLFEETWRRAVPYRESATRVGRFRARTRQRLKALMERAPESVPVVSDTAGTCTHPGVPVQIIGNQEFRHRWQIHRAHLRAIRRARRYILIENAYFIPNRPVRRALARAVRRGVVVAVAVAQHSDVTLAALASRSLYSELLTHGVRIFEWPHGMLHAKTMVVDDAWAVVGSYNLDHRSFIHQLEAVAVVVDPGFARCLRDQTLTDLAQCREVNLIDHESRSWRLMLLESAAYTLRYWL